jgi:hypothetical protein
VIALNPPIRAGLAVVHQLIEQAHDRLALPGTAGSPAGRVEGFGLQATITTPSPDSPRAQSRGLERGKGGEVPRLYLVGRTKQGVVRLAEKMRQVFGNAEEVAKGGGYRLYVSRRDS